MYKENSMNGVYRIDSISQLHAAIVYSKPLHPLITFIDYSKVKVNPTFRNASVMSTLYCILMKNKCMGDLLYGRGTYDFEEGTLVFMGPEQLVEHRDNSDPSSFDGWGLYFHPDLIRGHAIYDNLEQYSFFEYESDEALHLSEIEKVHIENSVKAIEAEYTLNPDDYSMEIILTNLELLLKYCKRFYSRQFNTRKVVNQDVVVRFTSALRKWYEQDHTELNGLPSVKYFAQLLNYSPNYLSDLLKKESGKTAQDHIYAFIINRAKDMLLNSDLNISQVAYHLGFEYPQHFSKLFKSKTGKSPVEWRN